MAVNLKGKSLLSLKDFNREELEEFLLQGEKLKIEHYAGKDEPLLKGKTVIVLFEKPSTRTRISLQLPSTNLVQCHLCLKQLICN